MMDWEMKRNKNEMANIQNDFRPFRVSNFEMLAGEKESVRLDFSSKTEASVKTEFDAFKLKSFCIQFKLINETTFYRFSKIKPYLLN